MTILDKPRQITRYQLLLVRQGLKACKIKLRLNTAYTPKNLRAMTEKATGKKFKARDYDGMIKALGLILDCTCTHSGPQADFTHEEGCPEREPDPEPIGQVVAA